MLQVILDIKKRLIYSETYSIKKNSVIQEVLLIKSHINYNRGEAKLCILFPLHSTGDPNCNLITMSYSTIFLSFE